MSCSTVAVCGRMKWWLVVTVFCGGYLQLLLLIVIHMIFKLFSGSKSSTIPLALVIDIYTNSRLCGFIPFMSKVYNDSCSFKRGGNLSFSMSRLPSPLSQLFGCLLLLRNLRSCSQWRSFQPHSPAQHISRNPKPRNQKDHHPGFRG